MGGGIFVVVALTPYGGWFKEANGPHLRQAIK